MDAVLKNFSSQLVETLPMDDATFTAELWAAGLLHGNVKTRIKSLPTPAIKAEYFLTHVIFPNLHNDDTNFQRLLQVMKTSDHSSLNKIASDIEGNPTSITPATGVTDVDDG